MATGDFGPGRMPPDMFYNYNEEIKRQKEQTIMSQNVLISRISGRGSQVIDVWGGGFWLTGRCHFHNIPTCLGMQNR